MRASKSLELMAGQGAADSVTGLRATEPQTQAETQKEAQTEADMAVIERHKSMCEELLEMEPESRWALNTQLHLLSLQIHLCDASTDAARGGAGGDAGDDVRCGEGGEVQAVRVRAVVGEMESVVGRLIALDPTRRSYYADMLSRAYLRAACDSVLNGGGEAANLRGLSLTSVSHLCLLRLLGIRYTFRV